MPFGVVSAVASACPASIDSDVDLVTLAEHCVRTARDLDDFLVVNISAASVYGMSAIANFPRTNGLSPDLGDLMLRSPGGGGTARRPRFEASMLIEAETLMGEGSLTRRSSGTRDGVSVERARLQATSAARG